VWFLILLLHLACYVRLLLGVDLRFFVLLSPQLAPQDFFVKMQVQIPDLLYGSGVSFKCDFLLVEIPSNRYGMAPSHTLLTSHSSCATLPMYPEHEPLGLIRFPGSNMSSDNIDISYSLEKSSYCDVPPVQKKQIRGESP
jgi:hypothetical protein